jgi:hypothetical protein
MHPSIAGMLKSFSAAHLPEGRIRETSMLFHDLAYRLAEEVPSSPDVTHGLRKLWDAKNVFVYAVAEDERVKKEES